MPDFAHLHLHTEFSLLDGMGRIEEYINRARETGIQHMAVTDHGVMYAAMDWYKAGTKAGLHPIIGMEAYLAEGKASARERRSYHLLLLAENNVGYRNLLKLASRASLEGYYYRPRIDLEMLHEHREGIIATSACLGGPVANNFLHNQPEKALHYAGTLAEIFGKERFFIEIQDHGLAEQIQTNREMIPLAKRLGLPLVATNDVHYCNEGDAPYQDVLVCVQTNTTIHDPNRLKNDTSQLYFKSPEEMWRVFSDVPDALTNTVRIAEMCNLDLGFKGYQLPDFDVPEGFTNESYLDHLCREGVMRLYGHLDGEVGTRLEYELGVIKTMGFTNYFLVVWDFIRFAKENGILVGPGRGSAAGSIVTYSLGITALDPLKYDLIFERFLNPSRISMPDIDIDFADDRRSEVIDYVVRKYGDERVAQIVTFGTLAAKASVRDVGRALGMTFNETDRVAKLIPGGPGVTIGGSLDKVPELRSLYEAEPTVRELIDTAQKIEGIARHSSTHAAGVVISRDPLTDHVPLQRAGGKSEGEITTQYPMGQLEEIGLLKMDFLGLRTLTVIGRAVELARLKKPDLTIENIPLDDPAAYELLRRGETVGVFQLEAGMTTRMTVDVQPSSFEDLIALMALIRPGPMEMAPYYIDRKLGKTPIEYMHPEMEQILKETYGVTLYQEQVMRIANVLAGFSMAEGDGLRKAMGKKLPEEMAKYRGRFLQGSIANGLGEKLAGEIYDMIERFAGYGFNKAHSAAYAVIAAQTAYLKANFPVEFMAAILTTEMGNTDRIVVNLMECRRTGIPVLPPDVNLSDLSFSVELTGDGVEAVRFGLWAIKNVGEAGVVGLIEARKAQSTGTFPDLETFCEMVDWGSINKRAVECLAKAGALDAFGPRSWVIGSLDGAIAAGQARQKATSRGQIGLFDMGGAAAPPSKRASQVDFTPIPQKELLAWEKELIGTYISNHPLAEIVAQGRRDGLTQILDLAERMNPGNIKVLGIVVSVRRITTKSNKTMAVIEVEDLTGSIEVVAFPETYERLNALFEPDRILEISGKFERRGEQPQLVAETITDQLSAARVAQGPRSALHLELPQSADVWQDIRLMQAIDELLRQFEGDDDVMIHVPKGAGETVTLRSRTRRVEWNEALAEELWKLLGNDAVNYEKPAIAS